MKVNVWLPWLRDTGDEAVRLFCFPHAGGGVSAYKEWQAAVPSNVAVVPVQLPGRESRIAEPPYRDITSLIAALEPALKPCLDRPFAFFGHSMGGLVSFELTRRLCRDGGPRPLRLFLSACPGPSARQGWNRRRLDRLPREELLAELAQMAGTPQEAIEHQELMDIMLPTIRADFELAATAGREAGRPLDLPITALGGADDEHLSVEELDAWGFATTGRFRRQLFAGGHFYLHTSREALLALVVDELLAAVTSHVSMRGS